MSLRRHLPALVSIAAISSALAQFAQRGSITGAVSDSTGAVVPDAKVTLIDLDQKTTSTTQTRSSGQYSFTQLNIGHYQVRVEKTGFAPAISTSIELATQQNARFDFTLVPGSTKQTIEVTSSTPLVEADRASVDQNIDFQQIQSLPISGRNYTSLVALAPAISTTPLPNINPGGTYNVGATHVMGGTQFAVGGQFEGIPPDNGYYINGVNATENYQGGSVTRLLQMPFLRRTSRSRISARQPVTISARSMCPRAPVRTSFVFRPTTILKTTF